MQWEQQHTPQAFMMPFLFLKIAKEVNPETITFLGGIHPTFCWEEILKKDGNIVDYVIRGEAEITTTELFKNIFEGKNPDVPGIAYTRNGKIICTKERPLVTNLDDLPMAWNLIEWEDYSFKTKKNSNSCCGKFFEGMYAAVAPSARRGFSGGRNGGRAVLKNFCG